jgi:hypothetical protein
VRASAIALLLVASACQHAKSMSKSGETVDSAADTALKHEVAAREDEARKLLITQSEMAWRNWVYGDPIDLASTYKGHETLFSAETSKLVHRLEETTSDPERKRALSYFRVYLASEVIGRAVAPINDQVANLEAEETFVGPGGEHPYRELERLTANERDHQTRVALYDSATSVVKKLNALLIEKEALTQSTLASLGYASYSSLGEQIRQVDLAALGATANAVLQDTDALYRASMDAELRAELGLPLADARRADISRFNRSADLDSHFPGDKMIDRLHATLLDLGFDLAKQKNIRVDDAPLPKKNPRAVCFNIVVPDDIRLSLKPLGGVTDYKALFHEAGHAEHYANTRTPIFEFQQLGDSAPTEAYAFILESLLENPLWLSERAGLSGKQLDGYVRGAAVKKLYILRRYAGKLLYEIAWHAGGKEPAKLYQDALVRAYAFPVSANDAQRFLVDHDDFFYAADYFRAWFLAAQIEEHLVSRFGTRWWSSSEAGKYLADLWSYGNELSVEEIARKLGDQGLRTEPLLEHFRLILSPAKSASGSAPANRPAVQ